MLAVLTMCITGCHCPKDKPADIKPTSAKEVIETMMEFPKGSNVDSMMMWKDSCLDVLERYNEREFHRGMGNDNGVLDSIYADIKRYNYPSRHGGFDYAHHYIALSFATFKTAYFYSLLKVNADSCVQIEYKEWLTLGRNCMMCVTGLSE